MSIQLSNRLGATALPALLVMARQRQSGIDWGRAFTTGLIFAGVAAVSYLIRPRK